MRKGDRGYDTAGPERLRARRRLRRRLSYRVKGEAVTSRHRGSLLLLVRWGSRPSLVLMAKRRMPVLSRKQGARTSRRPALLVATRRAAVPEERPRLAAGQRRQLRELGQAGRLSVRSCSITTGRPDTGRRRPLVTDLLTSLTLNLRSSQRQCPVIPGIRAAFGIRGADRALIGLVLVATGQREDPPCRPR